LDLENMIKNAVPLKYGREVRLGDLQFSILDAGHLPGSAQVLVKSGKKRVLYSGDVNTVDTKLLKGASNMFEEELDAVILESTYALHDHPDRASLESSFVKETTRVVEGGGTVLVPAFGVGRSQEVLCVLAGHDFRYPIWVDGMTRKANEMLVRNAESLRDPESFREAVRKANTVRGWSDRRNAAKKPGVIIAPAGMLKGGTAVLYLEKLYSSSGNAVFLVSFQIPGTPGRELMETGRFLVKGKARDVQAEVKHFDFSSHCGRKELHGMVKSMKGNPLVLTVHGDQESCRTLANDIKEEIGLSAVSPQAGDIFKI
jgi:putative mRNA 3-end processing factor